MKWYVSGGLGLVMAGIVLVGGYSKFYSHNYGDEFCPTSMVGVQHLGNDYSVSDFYVNKAWGGSAQQGGGGGGDVCCLMIPTKWRPGLFVEVRWEVVDGSHENPSDIKAGNYLSIKKRSYIAKVPVEKYDVPWNLYVHFFPRGRVRVLTTQYSVLASEHPVPFGLVESDPNATAGWPVKELFTEAELNEKDKRRDEWR